MQNNNNRKILSTRQSRRNPNAKTVIRKQPPVNINGTVPVMNGICEIRGNGAQTKMQHRMKFCDITQTLNVTNTGSVLLLLNVPQGVGVVQRTGDSAYYFKNMWFNFTVATQNADIFNTVRLTLVQWLPNTSLVACTGAAVFQVFANILSPYDFQNSNQFIIIKDWLITLSGLATSPTSSGFQSLCGKISLGKARKKIEWTAASANGSAQLFLIAQSDSAIAPFPSLVFYSRIMFYED